MPTIALTLLEVRMKYVERNDLVLKTRCVARQCALLESYNGSDKGRVLRMERCRASFFADSIGTYNGIDRMEMFFVLTLS